MASTTSPAPTWARGNVRAAAASRRHARARACVGSCQNAISSFAPGRRQTGGVPFLLLTTPDPSAVKRDRRDARAFSREPEGQPRFEACNHAGLDLRRAFRWPSPARARRAALAMRGLPWHPHLRSRRSMRGAGRGGPVSGRGISQLLTGRAVVLIATGRPVGRHAWGLPAWRGRVGIRAAADLRVRFADAVAAVCGCIQRLVTGSGGPTSRARALVTAFH